MAERRSSYSARFFFLKTFVGVLNELCDFLLVIGLIVFAIEPKLASHPVESSQLQ